MEETRMRSSPRLTLQLLLVLIVGLAGCSTYNYMNDASPVLEQSRVDNTSSHPAGEFNDKILSGQVTKGMTRYEVLVAWGNPNYVRNRKMTPDGVVIYEMWKYRENGGASNASTFILTFAGDLLDHIEVDRGYSPFSSKVGENSADTDLLSRDVGSKSTP
jgi:hypothetical protein